MEKRQENLEDKIVKRLAENHLSIAAAESCTGGLVAATLINVSIIFLLIMNII